MAEWSPITRGDDFDFDFRLEDEGGNAVPLSEVEAELHGGTSPIVLTVTPLGDDKYYVSLPGSATEPDPDTAGITQAAVTLCVRVTYTDGRRKTVIKQLLNVEDC